VSSHDFCLTTNDPQDLPVAQDEDDERQKELPQRHEYYVSLPATTLISSYVMTTVSPDAVGAAI